METPEGKVKKPVCRWARFELGAWPVQMWLRGVVGFPDTIMLLPGGRIIFVEFKAPGKEPNAKQQRWHDRLREYGFIVLVIDDIGRGKRELFAAGEALRPA